MPLLKVLKQAWNSASAPSAKDLLAEYFDSFDSVGEYTDQAGVEFVTVRVRSSKLEPGDYFVNITVEKKDFVIEGGIMIQDNEIVGKEPDRTEQRWAITNVYKAQVDAL